MKKTSTRFLVDLDIESEKDLSITSFDDNPNYTYKSIDDDGVDLHLRSLLECSDGAYDKMFEAEKVFGSNTGIQNQWENGGDFVIYKIK
jgi:hypothetical protein